MWDTEDERVPPRVWDTPGLRIPRPPPVVDAGIPLGAEPGTRHNAEAYGMAGLEVELVCMQRVALGLLGPGESGWLSLRRACEQVGVEEVPTHRAVADCVATVSLCRRLFLPATTSARTRVNELPREPALQGAV